MNAFTIKDLENLTGIKAHTIRIWEQRYTFLRPQRTDTNIRYYNKIKHLPQLPEDKYPPWDLEGTVTFMV
jgi:hypothetical protein